jgi:RecB family exonuclease
MRLGSDYLTGTLDRLFRNTAREWEVADYKTNKITVSEVKKIGRKYEMQMQTYALLTAQLFPGQSAYPVSLYFLLPEQEYRIVYTPEDVKNIYIEFTEIIEQIKQYYPFGERLLGE